MMAGRCKTVALKSNGIFSVRQIGGSAYYGTVCESERTRQQSGAFIGDYFSGQNFATGCQARPRNGSVKQDDSPEGHRSCSCESIGCLSVWIRRSSPSNAGKLECDLGHSMSRRIAPIRGASRETKCPESASATRGNYVPAYPQTKAFNLFEMRLRLRHFLCTLFRIPIKSPGP
jgi:hypothetical protein